MRKLTGMMLTVVLPVSASIAAAQPQRPRSEAVSKSAADDDLVARLMAFDKNKDGKLTKNEISDERLHRMFDRSDTNKDGAVTKGELGSLAAAAPSMIPGGSARGFMLAMPRPGEIVSPLFQQLLQLSAEQKAELTELQKDVDAKLEQILTDDQKKKLKELRERRPARFGPRGRGGLSGLGPRMGGPPGAGGRLPASPQLLNRVVSSSWFSGALAMADYFDSLANAIVDRSPGELVGAVMIALALSLAFAGLYFLGRHKARDELMPIIVLMIVANLASMAVAAGYLQRVKTNSGRLTVHKTQGAPALPDSMLVEFTLEAAHRDQDRLLSPEEVSVAAAHFVRHTGPSGTGLLDARSLEYAFPAAGFDGRRRIGNSFAPSEPPSPGPPLHRHPARLGNLPPRPEGPPPRDERDEALPLTDALQASNDQGTNRIA